MCLCVCACTAMYLMYMCHLVSCVFQSLFSHCVGSAWRLFVSLLIPGWILLLVVVSAWQRKDSCVVAAHMCAVVHLWWEKARGRPQGILQGQLPVEGGDNNSQVKIQLLAWGLTLWGL